MKPIQLSILLSFYGPLFVAAGRIRRDLQNIQVGELDGNEDLSNDREVSLLEEGSRYYEVLRCRDPTAILAYNDDKSFVGCCLPGQKLLGSVDTAFDCCAGGHDLVGSKATGYICCPTGYTYDGKQCEEPKCENGKVMVDGKCACPEGTVEQKDGTCALEDDRIDEDEECESGIEEGKCYTIRMDNGHFLGYYKDKWYTASPDSKYHVFGKFKFCKSEACDGDGDIDPGDSFRIKDIHGRANRGDGGNQWLDHRVNGGHIGKTPHYEKAGKFALSKWSCGKFCLTGAEHGLGPTCPSSNPAITFMTRDKEMCQPVKIEEVPCDTRDDGNNCMWETPEGKCGTG